MTASEPRITTGTLGTALQMSLGSGYTIERELNG